MDDDVVDSKRHREFIQHRAQVVDPGTADVHDLARDSRPPR